MTLIRRTPSRALLALFAFATIAIAYALGHALILAHPAFLAPGIGALTLVEAAKLSNTTLQRGVVETFVLEGAVLDQIPLMDIDGNSFTYNVEAALPAVEFRAVNAAYTEATGTFNQRSESLVILGGDADVDRFIQQTRSNINDQRAEQDRLKIKAATYKFQDTFINGDVSVDVNSFDGLKKRLTGVQLISAPLANGSNVIGASNAEIYTFFDTLDQLIYATGPGGADVLYMNSMILQKVKGAARRIGVGVSSNVDDFGRTIDMYGGVQLRDIGTKGDGTLIIPQTETYGTSAVTSSIYAVRWGQGPADAAVTGLTNGGIMVDDLGMIDAKPVLRTRIEFYCGLAVFGAGAARLKGILNA